MGGQSKFLIGAKRVFNIFNFLKPAPHIPEIEDQAAVQKKYKYWRFRVFYSMFMGYVLYYFTRKSFTFAMPSLIKDLGFDKSQLGILASVLAMTYGFSKFANGIIGDRSNPRYFMPFGLIMTGIFNICFGLSSSLMFFILFWGLNGWFQGCGWPGCARLLTHWYSQTERGRWWSFWNASHNIGGAMIPLITAAVAQYYGWRCAMFLPGVVCIFGGFFLMNRLCDTPQSLGLPPIEKFRNDYPTKKHTDQEHELTVKEILFTYVLTNPFIWILAASYFFIYVIREAIGAWTVLYLIEAKGYSQIGAGGTVMWFDIGGMFGAITAGWVSDTAFKGRRAPICIIFSACIAGALSLFWFYSGTIYIVDAILLFNLGFFTFGPQMLIGMAPAELSHKKAAATATGFVGWIAYLGAASAGYPLGTITQQFGWEAFFLALTICAIVPSILLLPLWGVRSAEDSIFRKKEAAAA